MADLTEIAARLRAEPPLPPTPTPELRTRIARRHRRHRVLLASVAVVIAIAGIAGARAAQDDAPVQVVSQPTPSSSAPPAAPLTADLRPKPVGAVLVVTRGMAGDTPWWILSYETDDMADRSIGPPDHRQRLGRMRCTPIVDAHSQAFPGGGGSCHQPSQKTSQHISQDFVDIGSRTLLFGVSDRGVKAVRVELKSGTVLDADLFPVDGTNDSVYLLDVPTTGSGDASERIVGAIRESYWVDGFGVEHTMCCFSDDEPGGTTTTTAVPDPQLQHYCDTVQAFRSSTAIGPDGVLGPAASPYLEAMLAAAPPEIKDAQQQLLDSVKTGAPAGDSAGATTRFWAEHCPG